MIFFFFFFYHGVSKNDVKNTKTKVETSFSLYNYRSGLIPSLPYKKGGHQEHKPKTQKKKKKKERNGIDSETAMITTTLEYIYIYI